MAESSSSAGDGSGAPAPGRHTPITGRKVRVLALHGAPANSNIMRFQTASLRRQLGAEVEWIFPDAQFETTPTEGLQHHSAHKFQVAKSAFEERISQGQPFTSWFRLMDSPVRDGEDHFEDFEPVISDQEMIEASLRQIMLILDEEAPIDVLVAFSQGALLGTFLANHLRSLGKPIPWRLTLLFTCCGPCPCDFFQPPLPVPAIFVTSPEYFDYDSGVIAMKQLYSDITIVLHPDGLNFPVTQPRAAEIYQALEMDFWRHCRETQRRGTWASWCKGSLEKPFIPPRIDAPGVARAAKPKAEVAMLAPEALVGLLRARDCLVVDSRTAAEARCRPFPGARGDLDLLRLQVSPEAAASDLTTIRKDGRRVVAISADGERCEGYCDLLVKTFGFRKEQVCRLVGGLDAWEEWEAEHEAEANEIRTAHGLPARKRTLRVGAVSPQELANYLLAGCCTVADARHSHESRGRPFPGANRDIGFFAAEKRPEEVRASLQRLFEDRCGQPLLVVTVSACGERCREYGAMLMEGFGLQAEQVARLEGGTSAWADWEAENPGPSADVRAAYGLPRVRRRA